MFRIGNCFGQLNYRSAMVAFYFTFQRFVVFTFKRTKLSPLKVDQNVYPNKRNLALFVFIYCLFFVSLFIVFWSASALIRPQFSFCLHYISSGGLKTLATALDQGDCSCLHSAVVYSFIHLCIYC